MSKTLHIAAGLTLPLDAASLTSAIMGIRGAGKTNTAVVIVEELLDAHQQCVVIDPTDSWWGLKSSKDGKRDGYPVVILGGKKGDLPLTEADGKTIADFVVDNPAVSIVLSLRHFESQNAERRFVTDFARRLYYRKGQAENPSPITLVIDEASRNVPQRVTGESAQVVGAIQQIVRQGRSSGFGVILIDQRPATVNKDVLAMLEMLVMHRVTSPQDRAALTAWIEQHDTADRADAFLDSLASLDKGDAWIWSPGFLDIFKRVHIRERRTFDSSYTPKIGERRATATKLAPVDLDTLRATLSQTIEKARADDPKMLRDQIAALKKERDALSHDVERGASKAELRAEYERGRGDAEVDGHRAGFVAGWAAAMRRASELTDQQFKHGIDDVISDLQDRRASIVDVIRETKPDDVVVTASVGTAGRARPRSVSTKPANEIAAASKRTSEIPATSIRVASDGTLSQRIVDTLGAMADCRIEIVPRVTVAAFVGMHPRTQSFLDALKDVRDRGLVDDVPGGGLTLTHAGARARSATGAVAIRTRADLHVALFRQLKELPGRILKRLIEAHPSAMDRADLATYIGMHQRTASFIDAVDTLANLGLVAKVRGGLVAADMLFPAELT